MLTLDQIRFQGRQAYYDGLDRCDNPYDPNHEDTYKAFEIWDEAWEDAELDD